MAADGTLHAAWTSQKHGEYLYGDIHHVLSPDNGETWEDYARTDETFNLYSIGGCRRATDDGYIIGSFTDSKAPNLTTACESKVYFFRLQK
ncbi:MAG TPA: hypothetical protein PLO37_10115 [Candidatus Hydrogenedentes bacterium]|nr:hypothetical protein [Candidatus Hydrogenedentota bacterium]HPG67188.1 hypothetical protein [Candidatus Hydrogenedentota bacterium]